MDIKSSIQEIILLAPPFLLALTAHELAHGYIAKMLGDPTAERAGRLTLNPLKHLDPMGVLCFIFIKIGWAKPVPVNPAYFKNPQKDLLKVSLAGPVANIILALVSTLLARIIIALPVLPLYIMQPVINMLAASIWINVMLAVFNFLPIPPLDGSKILAGLLPRQFASILVRLQPYGFLILLALFYTGILSKVLLPIISFANGFLVGY